MRKLSELNFDELKKLYENNATFKKWAQERAEMDADFIAGEYIDPVADSCQYELNSYGYSYIKIKDFTGFLYGCQEISKKFSLFSEELEKMLKKLLCKIDLFENLDYINISDKNYNNFESWFLKNCQALADAIKDAVINIYDYSYTDAAALDELEFLADSCGDIITDGVEMVSTTPIIYR